MKPFIPSKVFYEPDVLTYPQGEMLIATYQQQGIPMEVIRAHHKIESLSHRPNTEYTRMKRFLILGTRKTIKLTPNDKSADFIVPFTSSGCTAMCLYCYLMCHFNTNSYLRIFMNRQQMIDKVRKNCAKLGEHKIYELGCNSDMVLENMITGNLRWAIEAFGQMDLATATFATKFAAVDTLLTAKHNGHTQMRISVNPQPLIAQVEFGTSSLTERIEAANKMHEAGYRVGLNIAPIMLVPQYQAYYEELFRTLHDTLSEGLKKQAFLEVIFMTYGTVNYLVNTESMPRALNLLDKDKMRPKGPGKYTYRNTYRDEATAFLLHMIEKYLPDSTISYIV